MKSIIKSNVQNKEKRVKTLLSFIAILSIFTTISIVITLLNETLGFFKEVSLLEFISGTKWAPTLTPKSFGVVPLLVGTMMIALISSAISIPLGLFSAVYLSEYSSKKVAKIVKPILELLAGIPSIVYGFFALNFITPFLQKIFPQTQIFNAASAAIAVGIMTLPMIASLSEDAMKSVPNSIRQGAYALGLTKFETAVKIVFPAALPSIISAIVLSISRAIGETMVVAIAAGSSPILTLNPLKSIQTMTGFMVNISLGDIPYGSLEYKTVFVVGAFLFIITLIMNLLAKWIIKRFKEDLNGNSK